MSKTRYAICCSTEEQAREVGSHYYTAFATDINERYYKSFGYTIISYKEAKKLGLLGEPQQSEDEFENKEEALEYMEKAQKESIGLSKEQFGPQQSKTTVKDVLLYEAGLKEGYIRSEELIEKIMKLALDYVYVDGGHHKQYALIEIIKLIDKSKLPEDIEKGIPD